MNKGLLFFIALVGYAECSSGQPIPFENNASIADAQGRPRSSQSIYWPATAFEDSVWIEDSVWKLPVLIDSTALKWYSGILNAANEPILTNTFIGKQVIRLTWFRAFHPKIIIRIERSGDQIIMFQKKIRPLEHIKTGNSYRWQEFTQQNLSFLVNSKKKMDPEWWNQLVELFSKTKFDQMGRNDMAASDGAVWIIEFHSANGWYMVAKYSPDAERLPDFRTLGDFILDGSIFREEERY